MVPVYALESVGQFILYSFLAVLINGLTLTISNFDLLDRGQFLSLMDSDAAFNYEIVRDCYEAFALYCFERYLIACLGMFSLRILY